MKSRADLDQLLASLRIPDDRRAVVAAELRDHLESRIEAELAAGADREQAENNALAALGDVADLRASLERIEPAFDLDPRDTSKRGVASMAIAVPLFALAGYLYPKRPILEYDNPILIAVSALPGVAVLWFLAPRGIGAAIAAEARATLESLKKTKRRRAVVAYLWSLIITTYALAVPLQLFPSLRAASNDILYRAGLTWMPFCFYGLYLFARARREKKLLAADRPDGA